MPVEFIPDDTCVHCGRKARDYDGGSAGVGGHTLCHPNAEGRPNCYHLVTVYHHQLFDCARCKQDPWQPLTPAERHDALVTAMRRLEAIAQDIAP